MSADQQTPKTRQATGIVKSLVRFGMDLHVSLYRLTGGTAAGGARSFLILTTTGRKSGVQRDTPLFYFPDANRFIIIASANGSPRHPAWWHNLKSNPQAKIQIGSRVMPVTAAEATGEERARLWSIISEKYKNFVGYQQRTTREIPIVILTPEA